MFCSDHAPPHFHARYSGSRATIRIEPPSLLSGDLPPLDDGQERDVDLLPFLRGPVFEPLIRDSALFERVRVDPELGTIVWPNGADIDPDVLHEAGVARR